MLAGEDVELLTVGKEFAYKELEFAPKFYYDLGMELM